MQIKREQNSDTNVKLTITAGQDDIDNFKDKALRKLKTQLSVPGFRPGKAPAALVEKNIPQTTLHNEFLDQAINDLYVEAIQRQSLRPAAQPEITLVKFVPFSELEFTAKFDAVGDIELANYKQIKVTTTKSIVGKDDIDRVMDNLLTRSATKKPSTKSVKTGDEVVIDFKGKDAKTKELIPGTEGNDYPLIIGSNTFIPGFEDNLIGSKKDEEKTFPVTFPKDYTIENLRQRKVEFEVKIQSVSELVKPKLDDAFAASVGPFKTIKDLKEDIKKQLQAEKTREDQQKYDNELIQAIVNKSKVAIPDSLIDEEIDRIEADEKRNIIYRGQTWQEHLAIEGVTEAEHRERQREVATNRVKAGLILTEIAKEEKISIAPRELDTRIAQLKKQYTEKQLQAELDTSEGRRDILSRLMTEKTIDTLRSFAQKIS